LTKTLAWNLGPDIRVNAVAPGVALTDMGKSIPEQARAAMLANVPLGRFGEAAEAANVIVFLCSAAASYVTGTSVNLDGGMSGVL